MASGIRYCTSLPSIEKYEAFSKDGEAELPNITHPPVCFYSFVDLMNDISDGKANKPFHSMQKNPPKTETMRKRITRKKQTNKSDNSILDSDIQKKLEAKFDELFGALEDEEDN